MSPHQFVRLSSHRQNTRTPALPVASWWWSRFQCLTYSWDFPCATPLVKSIGLQTLCYFDQPRPEGQRSFSSTFSYLLGGFWVSLIAHTYIDLIPLLYNRQLLKLPPPFPVAVCLSNRSLENQWPWTSSPTQWSRCLLPNDRQNSPESSKSLEFITYINYLLHIYLLLVLFVEIW